MIASYIAGIYAIEFFVPNWDMLLAAADHITFSLSSSSGSDASLNSSSPLLPFLLFYYIMPVSMCFFFFLPFFTISLLLPPPIPLCSPFYLILESCPYFHKNGKGRRRRDWQADSQGRRITTSSILCMHNVCCYTFFRWPGRFITSF